MVCCVANTLKAVVNENHGCSAIKTKAMPMMMMITLSCLEQHPLVLLFIISVQLRLPQQLRIK